MVQNRKIYFYELNLPWMFLALRETFIRNDHLIKKNTLNKKLDSIKIMYKESSMKCSPSTRLRFLSALCQLWNFAGLYNVLSFKSNSANVLWLLTLGVSWVSRNHRSLSKGIPFPTHPSLSLWSLFTQIGSHVCLWATQQENDPPSDGKRLDCSL